jgi:hypothetical protein
MVGKYNERQGGEEGRESVCGAGGSATSGIEEQLAGQQRRIKELMLQLELERVKNQNLTR